MIKHIGLVLAAIVLTGSAVLRAQGTPPKPPVKTATAKPAAAPKMPAAVEAAFKKSYPNAVVKNVSKETAAGKTVYEVESVDAGLARNIDYAADGTVITIEEALKESDVPAAVNAAIKARYPKATITTRERLFTAKDNSSNFELGLKGAAVSSVELKADGTWVSPKLPVKK